MNRREENVNQAGKVGQASQEVSWFLFFLEYPSSLHTLWDRGL